MIQPNTQNRHTFCTVIGLCLALSMLTVLSIISIGNVKCGGRSLTADKGAKGYRQTDSSVTEITVTEPIEIGFDDSAQMKKVYKEYKKKKRNHTKKHENKTAVSDDMQSTTSTTASRGDEQTTVTTTVTSQTSPTTAANREPEEDTERVSNGKQPFNYNDVSSIADDLSTLGDFVGRLSPSSLVWNAEEGSDNGYVRITLESDLGSVVLDVKPVGGVPSDEEQSGRLNGDSISEWQWLNENTGAGCNISSVTWTSASFGIAPVRGIGIGSTLAQLTDSYLCVNGGATTLYRVTDVIEDQSKLNSILAAENLYTFVGGRVYSIGSYLDKYYNGREQSFRFDDCDYIVQYGCNSIMDHNYTTGSWVIEYAVKEDAVIGISFMNKSYYRTEQKTAVSTNISSSGSESGLVTTTRAESSEICDDVSDGVGENPSSEPEQQEQEEILSSDEDEADEPVSSSYDPEIE